MSVIHCKLQFSGRDAALNSNFTSDYTALYLLRTDSRHDGPQIVANHHELPGRYAQYIGYGNDSDPTALCISVVARPTGDDGKTWLATCKFTNNLSSEMTVAVAQPNPLLRPARWMLDWGTYSKIVEKDIEGNPATNTVGDVFDPPLEDDEERPILVAIKNIAAELFEQIATLSGNYANKLNSDTYRGQAPGNLKMAPLKTGEIQEENGYSFYVVRFEFHLNAEGWDRQILNRGPRAYEVPNDKKTIYPFTPIGTQKNLAANGTVLPIGAAPHYVIVKTKHRVPFSVLGI